MVIGKIRKFAAGAKLRFKQWRVSRKERSVSKMREKLGGGGKVEGGGEPTPPMYRRLYGGGGISMPSKESGLMIFGVILLIVGIAISFLGLLIYAIPLIIFAIMLVLLGKGASIGTILIVMSIIGAIAVFGIWFILKGGLQVSAGGVYQASQGIQAFFNSLAVRKFFHMLENPFGVTPTGGQYEETKEKGPPPNQALDVELRGFTNMVQFSNSSDIKALTFAVKVSNLGNYELKKVDVEIYSPFPVSTNTGYGCLRFDENELPSSCSPVEDKKGFYTCSITNIPAHGVKEIVLSKGYLDGKCMNDIGYNIIPGVPIDVSIEAKAKTYYGTASRLSVEIIDSEYAKLLLKHDMIVQKPAGAIYLAGTAMAVDMDIGDQPILEDVNQAGLLMSWVKTGKGGLDGNPIFLILTPKDFSECNVTVGKSGSKCDDALDICEEGNIKEGTNLYTKLEEYTPTMIDIINWTCKEYAEGNMHLCMAENMNEEFRTYFCDINLENVKVPEGLNRITEYITAVGIYPYSVKNSQMIKAYCLEGEDKKCA